MTEEYIKRIQDLLQLSEKDKAQVKTSMPAEPLETKIVTIQDDQGIKDLLEKGARVIIQEYEEEFKSLQPEADIRVNEVIRPWWQKFLETGLYSQILQSKGTKFLTGHSLNTPIKYFRPTTLYKRLANQEEYSLIVIKKPILRKWAMDRKETDIEGWYEIIADSEEKVLTHLEEFTTENWISKFYLPKPEARYIGFSGLGIYSWPAEDLKNRHIINGRARYGYSPTDIRKERVQLELVKECVLPNIHPTVLIQFSDQITSNTIWQNLEKILEFKDKEEDENG